MTNENSVKLLEEALNKANKAGVFSLQESVAVVQALVEIAKALGLNKKDEQQ